MSPFTLAVAQPFNWQFRHVAQCMPYLLQGLKVTIAATLLGMCIALVLGLVLAIMRRTSGRFGKILVGWPTGWLIDFIRSTPLLIQLYFIFYVLPDFGLTMDAFTTGVLALGIHYSSYTAEVYRAGIDGIARGQWEAATALNLRSITTFKDVILPQAIPPVIPALGNYFVAMFKDTPLLSAITVMELLNQAKAYSSRSFSSLEAYTLVGAMFLVLSLAAAAVVRQVERKLALPKG